MVCFCVLKLQSKFGGYLFCFYYSVGLVDVCYFCFRDSVSWLERKKVLKRPSLWVEYEVCVKYLGVSKNKGTPKGETNGKPYWNGWFGGTPIFGNIHLLKPVTSLLEWLSLFFFSNGRGWRVERIAERMLQGVGTNTAYLKMLLLNWDDSGMIRSFWYFC